MAQNKVIFLGLELKMHKYFPPPFLTPMLPKPEAERAQNKKAHFWLEKIGYNLLIICLYKHNHFQVQAHEL